MKIPTHGVKQYSTASVDETVKLTLAGKNVPTISFANKYAIPEYDTDFLQYSGFQCKEYTTKWTEEDIAKLKTAIQGIASGEIDCHTPDSVEYWISHYIFDSRPGYSKKAVKKYLNKLLQNKLN